MSKRETGAAGVKAAYVRPRIACFSAASESSLCVWTVIGGDAGTALPDLEGDLIEEEEP